MTREEATVESAKHTGLYDTIARRAVANGSLRASDIEDVIQDMYIKCINNLMSYDKSKGKVASWLTRPCQDVILNRVRRDAGERRITDEYVQALRCGGSFHEGTSEDDPQSSAFAMTCLHLGVDPDIFSGVAQGTPGIDISGMGKVVNFMREAGLTWATIQQMCGINATTARKYASLQQKAAA